MKNVPMLLSTLLVASLLAMGCGRKEVPPSSETQQSVATEEAFTFPATIAVLSQTRIEAETRVRRVKRDYANNAMGEYRDDKYNQAISLYDDAQIAFNSWIDEVKAGLTSSDFSSTANNSDRLREAVNKQKQFVDFVDGGYQMTRGAQSFNPALLAPLIAPLASAAIDIWEYFRDLEADKIEQMRNRLEEQKWRSWDGIQ
jgi:hypothetical protein